MFNFNNNIGSAKQSWINAKPFNHIVIDNFLPEDIDIEEAELKLSFNVHFF